jgi:hypothetical protein
MAIFSEAFLRLRQELDAAHDSRRKLIEDIQSDVRRLAHETQSQVAQQGDNRRAEFATMIRDLRGAIRRQADETRGQLAELAADLRQGGDVLRRRTVATNGFRGHQR